MNVNGLNEMEAGPKWRLMVEAAKRGAEQTGYTLNKRPGRGLSNVWELSKGGRTTIASIRTSQDRWIAFPPLESGKRWKTLDDVEVVLVAAVDSKEDPKKVEVYLLDARNVRERFNSAYAARIAAGNTVRDGYGMWVALDPQRPGIASGVGSGLASKTQLLAEFSIVSLIENGAGDAWWDGERVDQASEQTEEGSSDDTEPPLTIAEAKRRLAEAFKVRPENVKITIEA